MPNEFQYDVFLSHGANDKAVVRPLAERLRKDWPKLQPSAFIFQPFLDAPIEGSLTQFLYINWLPANRQLVRVAQVQGCGND